MVGIGMKVDIDGTGVTWTVKAIEPDPHAVWSFMDWSEGIDGGSYEGRPSSILAVLTDGMDP